MAVVSDSPGFLRNFIFNSGFVDAYGISFENYYKIRAFLRTLRIQINFTRIEDGVTKSYAFDEIITHGFSRTNANFAFAEPWNYNFRSFRADPDLPDPVYDHTQIPFPLRGYFLHPGLGIGVVGAARRQIWMNLSYTSFLPIQVDTVGAKPVLAPQTDITIQFLDSFGNYPTVGIGRIGALRTDTQYTGVMNFSDGTNVERIGSTRISSEITSSSITISPGDPWVL